MPKFKEVWVHVIRPSGEEFKEWGTRRLFRRNQVTTCIESQADQPFQIRIQPSIPFPDPGSSSDSVPDPPKFDLLITLHLDGREDPERSVVFYLDPDHWEFERHKILKVRKTGGRYGRYYEQGWIFKDVPVEKIFDKMLLSSNADDKASGIEDDTQEEKITQALASVIAPSDLDEQPEESRATGKIVVTIHRVTAGHSYIPDNQQEAFDSKEEEDLGHSPESGHYTVLGEKVARRAGSVRVVPIQMYDNVDSAYATFTFFYRSAEILEKFGFLGFPVNTKSKQKKTLSTNIASLTPLSIVASQNSRKRAAQAPSARNSPLSPPQKSSSGSENSKKSEEAAPITSGRNNGDKLQCITNDDASSFSKSKIGVDLPAQTSRFDNAWSTKSASGNDVKNAYDSKLWKGIPQKLQEVVAKFDGFRDEENGEHPDLDYDQGPEYDNLYEIELGLTSLDTEPKTKNGDDPVLRRHLGEMAIREGRTSGLEQEEEAKGEEDSRPISEPDVDTPSPKTDNSDRPAKRLRLRRNSEPTL